jgi:hypothetical protein
MGFVWKYRDGKNWYNAYNRSLGLRRKSLKTFIVGEAVARVILPCKAKLTIAIRNFTFS